MASIYHHVFSDVTLPYITNASPTEPRAHWVTGSNVMMTIDGHAARRPGFAPYTSDTGLGTVDRIFTWHRWDGTYFTMLSCNDGSGHEKVYKKKEGTDTTFQLLFTSNSAIAFDFTTANNFCFLGNGTDMQKYDGTTLFNWGIAKPAAAPTATPGAGSLSPAVGWKWKYAFGKSSTAHVGDISEPSTTSGPDTNKQYVITGSTTSDTQVDQVRVYRTLDNGGSGTFFELPNSPITYSIGWSLTDTANDTGLTNQAAPLPKQNAVPRAGQGVAYFANRIWVYSGDALYYSNFEEQLQGLEPESFANINKYNFGHQITGLVVVQKALLVFTSMSVYRIIGDALRTFQRQPFLYRAGAVRQSNISQNARLISWLDTTSIIQVSDGVNQQEIGLPIRNDVTTMTPNTSSCTFHSDGKRKWLVITDSAQNKTWIFDQDLGIWNVPWSIGGTALHSGEVGAGNIKLFMGKGGAVLAMTPSAYLDGVGATSYTASLTSSLFELGGLAADSAQRAPANSVGMNQRAGSGMTAWGALHMIGIQRNSVDLLDIQRIFDDDPVQASFTSIFSNKLATPPYRTQGIFLFEQWYYDRLSGRSAAIQFSWAAANTEFRLYAMDVAFEPGMAGANEV